jgi:Na+/pantothenate symporter
MRDAIGIFASLFASKSHLRGRSILYISSTVSLASLALLHVLHLSCKWRNINMKVRRFSRKVNAIVVESSPNMNLIKRFL